jgi:hypothetical protein
MKRITITILSLSLLCLSAFSQVNKQSKAVTGNTTDVVFARDTIATDLTPILSIKDVAIVDSLLQKKINKFELADYNQILGYLQQIVNLRVREYNIANKPSPAKKP